MPRSVTGVPRSGGHASLGTPSPVPLRDPAAERRTRQNARDGRARADGGSEDGRIPADPRHAVHKCPSTEPIKSPLLTSRISAQKTRNRTRQSPSLNEDKKIFFFFFFAIHAVDRGGNAREPWTTEYSTTL
ncbi:uncharacterized protein LOC112590471 [Harpegnathos saltator]|uniref:uncharacterized protein LOC112590471 n=1 Tax=Harpegnathos saltator TaxID=610380 RepID=UPI000DBED957|nr:uncharacterized protein LOC112590471 [Harpegnathos saltator]